MVPASNPRSSTRPPAGWHPRRARRGCTGPPWGGPSAPSPPTRRTSSASRTGRTPPTWRCRWAGSRNPRDGRRRRPRRTRRRRRSCPAGRGREARKDPAVVWTYAQLLFDDAEPLFEQYRRIDFARTHTVQADLTRKRASLKGLEQAYVAVVSTGDARNGIAALTRIGEAYADFAAKIRQAPTPRELSEEDRAQYRDELEQLAAPLEQRALETLQKLS